jgi:hypothetical protein
MVAAVGGMREPSRRAGRGRHVAPGMLLETVRGQRPQRSLYDSAKRLLYNGRKFLAFGRVSMIVPRTFQDQGESAAGPATRGLPACSSSTRAECIRCAESAESADRNDTLHGMNQASDPIMMLLLAATSR